MAFKKLQNNVLTLQVDQIGINVKGKLRINTQISEEQFTLWFRLTALSLNC